MEVGSRQSTQDVVWGPLVFEARRFVELRKKSLWQQFKSSESFGMGFFYTLNVRFLPMFDIRIMLLAMPKRRLSVLFGFLCS